MGPCSKCELQLLWLAVAQERATTRPCEGVAWGRIKKVDQLEIKTIKTLPRASLGVPGPGWPWAALGELPTAIHQSCLLPNDLLSPEAMGHSALRKQPASDVFPVCPNNSS